MNLKVKVAVCALNQWALDFEGNCGRIKQSIEEARRKGATYRLGSELEITGFGCDDHFYEGDTLHHSWEVLAELLQMEESKHMICDVSMPVVHKNSRYNCRVIFMYKKLILIRPKLACCNQGNYRELRWFVPWFKKKSVEDFVLPVMIQEITGQVTIPIGDAVISTRDTCLGSEICEELWTADSSHVSQALDGVEIFTNGSASHFNLRKIQERMDLVKTATAKVGGAYLYANQHGCDGGRLYYDGCSMIAINGNLVACGAQFSMRDIDICFATFDLSDIRSFRGERSSMAVSSSSHSNPYPRVCLHDFVLARCDIGAPVSAVIERPVVFGVAEEIEFGPACWLWDYLRRSGMSGFFLPLSGGIDSSSVACIVYSMCEMVCKEIESGNELVLADVRRVVKNEEFRPKTPQQLCGEVLTTCYMASENSSEATRARATGLASHIGATHLQLKIDTVVNAFLLVFTSVTGFIPRFAARGGSKAENLALQNIQARCRMVMAYLCAQLLQWVKGRAGSLLVLGSSNVDEVLRGYYTKYDCSSADLNPIGGVNKAELKLFMLHCLHKYDIAPLRDIVQATPTAELEPLQEGEIAQSDEVDMGMTYDELTVYGRLRKLQRCGPFSMFEKLIALWRNRFSPAEVAAKVKHFFVSYAINRHKTTTLTPSMHAENYSPDDNRFDLRPFLYNTKWTWQFRRIDEVQAVIDKRVQAAKLLGQDDSEVD